MSEYWVSRKKYFCKYCETFIADDAPSRQHHENGLRHKGNKERFVRGLYKASERKKKDGEDEKREMARVEKAAAAAYALDVGAGHAKPGPSSASTSQSAPPPAPRKPAAAAKPSNPYANYTTAESLGFVDPELERIKEEQERHRTQGVVGDWEIVAPAPPPPPPLPEEEQGGDADGKGRKREFAVMRDVQGAVVGDEEEDGRSFKVRKKTASVGLGEIWDPIDIPIKLKAKKEEPADAGLPSDAKKEEWIQGSSEAAPGPIKWTPRTWKKADDVLDGNAGESPSMSADLHPPQTAEEVKPEIKDESLATMDEETPLKQEDVKTEPVDPTPAPPPSSGGMFRKRKIAGGAGAGQRGKRF